MRCGVTWRGSERSCVGTCDCTTRSELAEPMLFWSTTSPAIAWRCCGRCWRRATVARSTSESRPHPRGRSRRCRLRTRGRMVRGLTAICRCTWSSCTVCVRPSLLVQGCRCCCSCGDEAVVRVSAQVLFVDMATLLLSVHFAIKVGRLLSVVAALHYKALEDSLSNFDRSTVGGGGDSGSDDETASRAVSSRNLLASPGSVLSTSTSRQITLAPPKWVEDDAVTHCQVESRVDTRFGCACL